MNAQKQAEIAQSLGKKFDTDLRKDAQHLVERQNKKVTGSQHSPVLMHKYTGLSFGIVVLSYHASVFCTVPKNTGQNILCTKAMRHQSQA